MPATVTEQPLGLDCVFLDGSRAQCLLREDVLPVLARQLLRALADLVVPHGGLGTAGTVKGRLTTIHQLLCGLHQLGFTGDASALTRTVLAEYWMGRDSRREAHDRGLLRRLNDLEHVLAPDVRHMVDGRTFHPRLNRNRRPLPAYSAREWKELTASAEYAVVQAWEAHRQALRDAARGGELSDGLSRENIQFSLLHHGPQALGRAARNGRPGRMWRVGDFYTGGAHEAVSALFPRASVAFAYRLLFGIRTGIVSDGLADLGLGDVRWSGDVAVLLDYVKGRTGKESLTLSRPAVRVLKQWLKHTDVARRFAPRELREQLWLRYWPGDGSGWSAGRFENSARATWVRDHQLVDDAGRPLRIHLHRIRTTVEASRDRTSWRGSSRATIDPNHTPAVEGDHYLAGQGPAQRTATENVIEDAQRDLVRRSHAQPVVIAAHEDLASFVRDFPQAARQLRLDDMALAELLGGERDVFAASCADQLSGLHGPAGQPCPARPWVCLLCPLAVFSPRHLPNLMRLRAYFARQWRLMPAAAFLSVFGPYAQRLDELLTPDCFEERALQHAAPRVTDLDSELPLRPEEYTE
ncbi:hypothetical protein ACFXKC_55930 [Streptomyces sp. NPDC059340]|uniref:hypothetical protein n=1 Tax=Streptomyces sp. NPDC059340 TaxID=3346806 RepID=UPI0036832915